MKYRAVLVAMSCMAVVGLACPAAASAQERHDRTRVWAAGGLGMGGSKQFIDGGALLVQLAFQKSPHYASIRTMLLADIAGFPDSGGGDVYGEAGLTYGRTITTGFAHAAVHTGLSVMSMDVCPGDRDYEGCYTVGIPLVAEASLSAKVIGIGVQVFANINPKAPYAGVFVFLQLGWMP